MTAVLDMNTFNPPIFNEHFQPLSPDSTESDSPAAHTHQRRYSHQQRPSRFSSFDYGENPHADLVLHIPSFKSLGCASHDSIGGGSTRRRSIGFTRTSMQFLPIDIDSLPTDIESTVKRVSSPTDSEGSQKTNNPRDLLKIKLKSAKITPEELGLATIMSVAHFDTELAPIRSQSETSSVDEGDGTATHAIIPLQSEPVHPDVPVRNASQLTGESSEQSSEQDTRALSRAAKLLLENCEGDDASTSGQDLQASPVEAGVESALSPIPVLTLQPTQSEEDTTPRSRANSRVTAVRQLVAHVRSASSTTSSVDDRERDGSLRAVYPECMMHNPDHNNPDRDTPTDLLHEKELPPLVSPRMHPGQQHIVPVLARQKSALSSQSSPLPQLPQLPYLIAQTGATLSSVSSPRITPIQSPKNHSARSTSSSTSTQPVSTGSIITAAEREAILTEPVPLTVKERSMRRPLSRS